MIIKKINVKTMRKNKDSYIINEKDNISYIIPINTVMEIEKLKITVYSHKTIQLIFKNEDIKKQALGIRTMS